MKIVLGSWVALGNVRLDREGRLVFPAPTHAPGLYRFRLIGPAASVYVGETDDLHRRFAHYRSPGPSQRTNVRMNEHMRTHLQSGRPVSVETCTETWVEVGSEREALDLSRGSHRVLAEEEALGQARAGGMGSVENVGG